jgi:hypothetical protein
MRSVKVHAVGVADAHLEVEVDRLAKGSPNSAMMPAPITWLTVPS